MRESIKMFMMRLMILLCPASFLLKGQLKKLLTIYMKVLKCSLQRLKLRRWIRSGTPHMSFRHPLGKCLHIAMSLPALSGPIVVAAAGFGVFVHRLLWRFFASYCSCCSNV